MGIRKRGRRLKRGLHTESAVLISPKLSHNHAILSENTTSSMRGDMGFLSACTAVLSLNYRHFVKFVKYFFLFLYNFCFFFLNNTFVRHRRTYPVRTERDLFLFGIVYLLKIAYNNTGKSQTHCFLPRSIPVSGSRNNKMGKSLLAVRK